MSDPQPGSDAHIKLLPGGRIQLDVLVYSDDDGRAEIEDAAADNELSDAAPPPPPPAHDYVLCVLCLLS